MDDQDCSMFENLMKGHYIGNLSNTSILMQPTVYEYTCLFQACIKNTSTHLRCITPDLGEALGISDLLAPVYFNYGFIMDGVQR